MSSPCIAIRLRGGQDIDVGTGQPGNSSPTRSLCLRDAIGTWHLDETGGTTAADVSGSGNTGLVTSPVWSTNGKIGGALGFNGTSSQVQIANPARRRFQPRPSGWKTTQAGGTGQWYNGVGLGSTVPPARRRATSAPRCAGGKTGLRRRQPRPDDFCRPPRSTTGCGITAWRRARSPTGDDENSTWTARCKPPGWMARRRSPRQPPSISAISRTGRQFPERQPGRGEVVYPRTRRPGSRGLVQRRGVPRRRHRRGLTAASTSTQVMLNWGGVLWATSYDVKRATISGGPYTKLANVTLPTYTDADWRERPPPYYYVVTGVKRRGGRVRTPTRSARWPVRHLTWFDANALTGLTNGSAVASWPDTGGTGINATQTTASQRPVYLTGGDQRLSRCPVLRAAIRRTSRWRGPYRMTSRSCVCSAARRASVRVRPTSPARGWSTVRVSGTTNDFGTSINVKRSPAGRNGAAGCYGGFQHQLSRRASRICLPSSARRRRGHSVCMSTGTLVSTATGGDRVVNRTFAVDGGLSAGAQQLLHGRHRRDQDLRRSLVEHAPNRPGEHLGEQVWPRGTGACQWA